ncbi:MAG: phosphatase PAP2 family protein [Ktedonobacteraceae bacterium]
MHNMALPENDESTNMSTDSKPLKPLNPFYIRLAHLTSIVLSPVTISLPFIALVALSSHESNVLLSAALTLFFLSVGPTIYILLGVRSGKFTDVDVSVRSQRTGPFLFSIVSSLIGFFVLSFIHGSKNLESVLLITVISGIILMVVTFWWKISMHASSLSGAITMLSILYGKVMLPAFLLVLLVSWSRVVLRRHTIAQVAAGSLMSIALSWLLLTIRGI